MTLAGVTYLQDKYPFKSPESRRNLANSANLDPIEDWGICDDLHHTRLFSFQTTWGMAPAIYEVIGITDRGVVLRLEERSDFNALLRSEGIVPRDTGSVLRIARLYFQIIGITSSRNYGIREVIQIINSIDDIPFGTKKDREDVATRVEVSEPSVRATEGGGFLFTGYSWSKHGSGAIYKRELKFDKEGVLSVSATLLVSGIGIHEAIE